MKTFLTRFLLFFAIISTFSACEEEIIDTFDPSEQAATDEALILEYIARDTSNHNPHRTATGVYYFMRKAGNGAQVQNGNTVKINYLGRFLNGSKFDSSYDRNTPLTFVVGAQSVIPGLDEGIRLTKKGESARLYIPSAQAYGRYGSSSGSIPPNAVLVFDIDVLDVTP